MPYFFYDPFRGNGTSTKKSENRIEQNLQVSVPFRGNGTSTQQKSVHSCRTKNRFQSPFGEMVLQRYEENIKRFQDALVSVPFRGNGTSTFA